jgi:8-oxo-dGTP pyrophosphatase MutT (NUDIX family)
MYKVFINNRPLIIAGNDVGERMVPGTLFLRDESSEVLDVILDLAHTEKVFFKQIYLIAKNPVQLFELLESKCKIVLAAGGLVKNENGRLLMIFRNDKWDLPKGKVEKGESVEEAGIREVEEECGIGKLTITKKLSPTYHTYIHKEKIVLKKTFWFEMLCTDDRQLKPQQEEGITEVKWMSPDQVEMALENTYLSIIDVVRGK